MKPHVTAVDADLGLDDIWQITVRRAWSPSAPRAADVPPDIREALAEWLKTAEAAP